MLHSPPCSFSYGDLFGIDDILVLPYDDEEEGVGCGAANTEDDGLLDLSNVRPR
jgi:hypothetical protein